MDTKTALLLNQESSLYTTVVEVVLTAGAAVCGLCQQAKAMQYLKYGAAEVAEQECAVVNKAQAPAAAVMQSKEPV